MKVTVENSTISFERAAARRIVDQILSKSDSVVGLSTGRTTGGIHRSVVEMYWDRPFDLSGVTFFGLDEVTGVSTSYPGSCWAMLHNEIADPLGLEDGQLLMLPTRSDDFEKDCRLFREQLSRRGGIDLLVLGLGENGHLGFNQPGSPFDGRAWVSVMYPELEQRIRRESATPEGVPLGGVTLGLADIMEARRLLLVANGSRKAEIVQRMLEGPVTEDVPASILQRHPRCEFLLDREAAAMLSRV